MRRSLPSFEMLNPRKLRSSGRATAFFASLTFSRSFLVRNRLTETITRSPTWRAEKGLMPPNSEFSRSLATHRSEARPYIARRPAQPGFRALDQAIPQEQKCS